MQLKIIQKYITYIYASERQSHTVAPIYSFKISLSKFRKKVSYHEYHFPGAQRE